MANDTLLGYMAVLGSCMFFGSFGIFFKNERLVAANVNPIVVQFYMSCMICLSSPLVLIIHPDLEWDWYGVLGALMWTNASILSILAIRLAGLGIAQGIWAGFTVVTSFFLGAVGFGEEIRSLPMVIFALLLMVVGILGVASCELTGRYFGSEGTLESQIKAPLYDAYDVEHGTSDQPTGVHSGAVPDDGKHDEMDEPAAASVNAMSEGSRGQRSMRDFMKLLLRQVASWGSLVAAGVGLINGCMMLPLHYDDMKWTNYTVAFGVGTLATAAVWVVIVAIWTKSFPTMHCGAALRPAFAAGLFWNVGNVFSIYSTRLLGQSVGFSLTQCALLVAGVWSIVYFRELKQRTAIYQWVIAGVVVVAGAVLLGVAGRK